MKRLLLFIVMFWVAMPAAADELRPAYVELTQSDEAHWTLIWKASARSRLGRAGEAVFPDNCKAQGRAGRRLAGTNIITSIALICDGPVIGGKVGLKGLELATTDALARVAPLRGDVQNLRLTPDRPAAIIAAEDKISNVAATYTLLGIEHILLGFDHLLFVLGLVLLIRGGWAIVKTVTAFTIAHSITLAGSVLGAFTLPQRPVEAVIALSIIFLAVEIVKARPGDLRLSERFPWIVAFLFGLLHGFGFAGALAEIGLPQGEVPMALLTFNIGVEIGQLMIVAAAVAVILIVKHFREALLRPARMAMAYGIGIIATYWFIERLA